ncbi:MAG TPA: DUF2520 domain-containing protein [Candidatus Acidoferrales bacterium]|nr:DUF2520 domain-containing protein [Candidatus Acidoferrales bacterium]
MTRRSPRGRAKLISGATTVAIVGGGRVGRALGRQLRLAGWRVTAVVTRSETTARRAARYIGACRPYGKLTRLLLAAKVVLIAVPDDSVSDLAKRLARMGGEEWKDKVVLHTSGALDSRTLAPLADKGAETGSIHPLQSFSARVAPSLEGVWIVMEGSVKALSMARRMARDLGGFPLQLRSDNKLAYHAAGVFSAAHVLTMIEAGTRIFMSVGFSRRQAGLALLKLARQVMSNFERFGPGVAWSGPVPRGDFGTVAGHIRALRRYPREYGEAYAAVHRLGARVLSRRPGAVLAKLEPVLTGKMKKNAAKAD